MLINDTSCLYFQIWREDAGTTELVKEVFQKSVSKHPLQGQSRELTAIRPVHTASPHPMSEIWQPEYTVGARWPLFFNLEAMEQYFVSYLVQGQPIFSDLPPVQVIIEVPWDAAAMASLAAKADNCLRSKILVMVIDRYRSDEHLDSILPLKACPWTIVSKSTTTFSAELYEKFVDSVEGILQTFAGDIMGDMIKGSEDVGNGPVQIAFKPVERSVGSSSELRSVNGTTVETKAF